MPAWQVVQEEGGALNVPAAHCVERPQAAAPTPLNVPLQALQFAEPGWGEKVPGAHGVQPVAPGEGAEPAGQGLHCKDPEAFEKVP